MKRKKRDNLGRVENFTKSHLHCFCTRPFNFIERKTYCHLSLGTEPLWYVSQGHFNTFPMVVGMTSFSVSELKCYQ